MNKKGLVSAAAAFLLIIAVAIFMRLQEPDLSQYMALKDPALRTMPPQRVLMVTAQGTPGKAGKKAFGLLMKTYFGLKGVPKGGPGFKAPRARWPLPATVPESQWIGLYAMPIPDSIKAMKLPSPPEGMTIQLTTWQYGRVAEILHVGPYDKEQPAIQQLHEFIENNGCRIAGMHEEEYLKGPGMFFRGDPKKYHTIIRYQVQEKDSSVTATAFAKH
jgi:effector-binding domain-containing protein